MPRHLPNRLRGLVAAILATALAMTAFAAAVAAQTVIAPTAPATAISSAHPVVTVPVVLTRTDATPVLGFSVRIRLSANLSLGAGNISEGTFLPDGATRSTNFQVIDNGGGIYTVDGVTLGADCGPTTLGGTLFDIHVQGSIASATDTVSIVSVKLRDCSNGILANTVGGPVNVEIDNTAPVVAVTSPNGGEHWVQGILHAITWTATDAAGVTGVDLAYSVDNGSNWIPVATGEPNDGTYSWTVPNTVTTTALVRATATDANGNSASDASDAVFEIRSNSEPVLGAIGNKTVNEGAALTFTATATDGESPPQVLTFSLDATPPAGASINPSTGEFSWTPTEAQGPGTYNITVRVTDDGTPNLDDFETIQVTVNEVNVAPVLDPIGNPTASEGVALTFTAHATDADLPANTLTYSLDSGAPSGATINPSTGDFSWTPGETDGGTVATVTVRVTDDGTPNLDDFETISITVNETNQAPVLSGVPASVTIPELVLYSFTASATDADVPAQTLTFSLVGAPAGASIDANSGVFTWTPDESQGPGNYAFSVRVTDGIANTDAPISIQVDEVALAAIADLAAAQQKTGNDADGTGRVALIWSGVGAADSVLIYRAGFGDYPEYDDGSGSVPAVPSFPPGAPWERAGAVLGNAGFTDETPTRDFWYYVAFVHGAGENYSPVSNRTGGTLNYLLGDVTDGSTPGNGDNVVNIGDLSLLGANYGLTGAGMLAVNYLDVGPTTDLSVDSQPFTDNKLDFEDLVMFAINYGTGPTPQMIAAAAEPARAGTAEHLVIEAPATVNAGDEFAVRVRLASSGRVSAVSLALAWNPAVAQPVDAGGGEWLASQNGVAMSPGAGAIDVARLGGGFVGEGEVAVLHFRAVAAGAPNVAVASVKGRDILNHPVDLSPEARTVEAPLPSVTAFSAAAPNPFRGSTTLSFALAQSGHVELVLYSVDGRRMRTLENGERNAGVYHVNWDGRDDAGAPMAPGVYYARFAASGKVVVRKVSLVR